MTDWAAYQERAADFFRSIGLDARTNVTLEGVRTSHDIDVVVRSKHVGFDLLWLVECKYWNTPVSKLHVLALREIVSDLGADRGILLAESGYQRGALEAANLTNVQLTSIAELVVTAGKALGMAQLRNIQERIDQCRVRYWNLDKETRINHGLRPEVGGVGYSATSVIDATEAVINSAFWGGFPILIRDYHVAMRVAFDAPQLLSAKTPNDLVDSLEPLIADLEMRLDTAYAATHRGNNQDKGS
jgi:restriction system protein